MCWVCPHHAGGVDRAAYVSLWSSVPQAEEFAQVKEREMSGGSCYACSAPLASSSPSTWSPAFSSSSSSSSTHGFRHESAAVSGGARRGSSSTGEQREGDEEKEDGQRQRKYLSFQHLNETQGIECEDNLQVKPSVLGRGQFSTFPLEVASPDLF